MGLPTSKYTVCVGEVYGRWTVLEVGLVHGKDKLLAARCRCACEFQTEQVIPFLSLHHGATRACRHCAQRKHVVTLGQRFGLLVVTETGLWISRKNGSRVSAARCRCACDGVEKVIAVVSLCVGDSRSCGCQQLRGLASGRRPWHKHGLSYHPLYKIHYQIVARCTDPTHHAYPSYGGRGITVYEPWLDLATFIAWVEANLGPRPPGQSLDRIDNDRGYEPGNLRWADGRTQAGNRRKVLGLSSAERAVVEAMRRGLEVTVP